MRISKMSQLERISAAALAFGAVALPAEGRAAEIFGGPVVQVMPAALQGHKNTSTGVMGGMEFGLKVPVTDRVGVFGRASGLMSAKDFTTKEVHATASRVVPYLALTTERAAGAAFGAEWRIGPIYVGAGVGLKQVWTHTQLQSAAEHFGIQSEGLNGRALVGTGEMEVGVEAEPLENVYVRGFMRAEYGRALIHTAHGPKQSGGIGGGFSAGFRF